MRKFFFSPAFSSEGDEMCSFLADCRLDAKFLMRLIWCLILWTQMKERLHGSIVCLDPWYSLPQGNPSPIWKSVVLVLVCLMFDVWCLVDINKYYYHDWDHLVPSDVSPPRLLCLAAAWSCWIFPFTRLMLDLTGPAAALLSSGRTIKFN